MHPNDEVERNNGRYEHLSHTTPLAMTYGQLVSCADNSDSATASSNTGSESGSVMPPQPVTDTELLGQIAGGNTEALGEFYDRHAGTLFAVAYRMLNDHKEAEDLVQDVLLQVWEKRAAFDPAQGRPLAWVIALARNKAIDRLRSVQRRARLLEEADTDLLGYDNATPVSADAVVGAGEHAEMVRAALVRLPAEQRRSIEMAFYGGLTQSEIAAELNEALGTIKARIRRGMLRLREDLGNRLCS